MASILSLPPPYNFGWRFVPQYFVMHCVACPATKCPNMKYPYLREATPSVSGNPVSASDTHKEQYNSIVSEINSYVNVSSHMYLVFFLNLFYRGSPLCAGSTHKFGNKFGDISYQDISYRDISYQDNSYSDISYPA